jgi:hypothetical protein
MCLLGYFATAGGFQSTAQWSLLMRCSATAVLKADRTQSVGFTERGPVAVVAAAAGATLLAPVAKPYRDRIGFESHREIAAIAVAAFCIALLLSVS